MPLFTPVTLVDENASSAFNRKCVRVHPLRHRTSQPFCVSFSIVIPFLSRTPSRSARNGSPLLESYQHIRRRTPVYAPAPLARHEPKCTGKRIPGSSQSLGLEKRYLTRAAMRSTSATSTSRPTRPPPSIMPPIIPSIIPFTAASDWWCLHPLAATRTPGV